ncbi:hypothetical protein CN198_13795 [Sinorhizobium meliloti]|uniref:hypothetical protein n=1 Tax=Rhizobium meliloti TaxID=382 RepID=UPI000FDB9FCF|nr:hypothetical protein [Sinorhizobium meliloti]RVH69136.1 hypothetical protein CN198_13795 [Sinorhizobium meliloti]
MTTTLTDHQKMFIGNGIPRSDARRLIGFLAMPIRGSVPLSRFTKAADIIAVVDRDGEKAMETRRIPAELREGATLEVLSGGSRWGAYGLVSQWERRATDWHMVGAYRKKMGGGPDTGKLKTTPEQDWHVSTVDARTAYAIRARFSGDRDD